jgi:hypothetical protein
MHPILRAGIATGVVGLGLLEAALGLMAEQTASAAPELAHLRLPVLALALAFCACGQLALLAPMFGPSSRSARAAGVLMLAMAGLLIAIELVTGAEGVTPPGFVLVGWGSALALTAVAATIVYATATRQRAGSAPAARAGSA